MNEKEMREKEAVRPNSIEELTNEIHQLLKENDDYGKAVYAVSLAAVATFNYMAGELGITGFQASCADLDILRRTRRMEYGFKILDFDKLLYPQYTRDFNITATKLLNENIEHLSKAAKENLKSKNACAEVVEHWEMIAKLGETP